MCAPCRAGQTPRPRRPSRSDLFSLPAQELRVWADGLWLTSRRIFFIGSPSLSPRAEAELRALRGDIDVLAAHLRERRPPAALLDPRRLVPDCTAAPEVRLELEAHRAAYGMPCIVRWWNRVSGVFGHPIWEREAGRYEGTWNEWLMERLMQEVRFVGGKPVKREGGDDGVDRSARAKMKREGLDHGTGIFEVKRECEESSDGVETRRPLSSVKMEHL